MKTRTQKPSTLRAALGGAGLARTGAMLALALGAAQAGAATTYTVPLQFNITLSPPVCTLKVLTLTADAGTDAPALTSGNMVNLATMSVSKSPQDIVAAMTTTTSLLTGASAGFHTLNYGIGQRFVTTPPTATANCTAGTPMIATITRGSLASSGSAMGGVASWQRQYPAYWHVHGHRQFLWQCRRVWADRRDLDHQRPDGAGRCHGPGPSHRADCGAVRQQHHGSVV